MSAHRDKYAEKRPQRSRQCRSSTGVFKQRFETEVAANEKVERFDHPLMRAYLCDDCGFWHVGKRKAAP